MRKKRLISMILLQVMVWVVSTMLPMQVFAFSTVKLQLSWRHQFQFAGYYAAVEKGFYRDVGLDVQLLEGGPSATCNERMLRQVEYCNASGSILKQRLDGQPIVALAAIMQNFPGVLLTRKDSQISQLRELLGKRVEALQVGQPILEVQAMFQYENMDLSELQARDNSSGVQALIDGDVDALYAFLGNEPYQLQQAGLEYNVLYPHHYQVDFYGDVLLTSEQELARHPLRVKKFREASLKGWRYAMNHQQELIDIIIRKYNPEKSQEQLHAEAQALELLMMPHLIQIGHMNPDRWQQMANTLQQVGLVSAQSSLDGFIYKDDEESDYRLLISWLTTGLFIASLIAAVLWLFNYRLSLEIAERIKAQDCLRKANAAALKQAYTDDLSGMGNRRSFYKQGEAAIILAMNNKAPLSLIVMDIDHFKQINDLYGHLVGDEAIRALAQVVLKIVRSSDIQGRIGGEEFAIMLPQTNLQDAINMAERIRESIAQSMILIEGYQVKMTASFGVTVYMGTSDDINRFVKRADDALYLAKNQGRNQVMSLRATAYK